MTLICFIVVATLLVILQTTLLMPIPVWAFAPDFYFILVAYLASRFTLLPALILVYIIGLMLDVLTGTVLGMFSSLCFTGFALIRLFANKVVYKNFLYSIPLIALAFFALSGLVYLVFDFLYPDHLVPWVWWEMAVRTALVALFTYPLFRLFDVIHTYGENTVLPWKRLRTRPDSPRRRQT
ncbi:MAG: rod shape-determining protein MreD [Desulfobulbaceae bacterium]|nr:rod shape-determining protein MreD [Desulfobulbaceae bacterium]